MSLTSDKHFLPRNLLLWQQMRNLEHTGSTNSVLCSSQCTSLNSSCSHSKEQSLFGRAFGTITNGFTQQQQILSPSWSSEDLIDVFNKWLALSWGLLWNMLSCLVTIMLCGLEQSKPETEQGSFNHSLTIKNSCPFLVFLFEPLTVLIALSEEINSLWVNSVKSLNNPSPGLTRASLHVSKLRPSCDTHTA